MAVGYGATRAGLFARADMRVFGQYVINISLRRCCSMRCRRAAWVRCWTRCSSPPMPRRLAGDLAAGVLWARKAAGKGVSAAAMVGMGMSCPNSGFIGFPLVAAAVRGPATRGRRRWRWHGGGELPAAAAVAGARGQRPGEAAAGQGARRAAARGARASRLRGVARNPMIWGIALGFLFSLFGWRLPAPLARAVDLFAARPAAVSLMVIGGSLVGIPARGHGARRRGHRRRQAAAASAGGAACWCCCCRRCSVNCRLPWW